MKISFIIGIDEAGRGSFAGPVAVGAVIMPRGWQPRTQKIKSRLKDSKKLTPKARNEWFAFLKKHPKISHTVAMIGPKIIDKINISEAVNRAATYALKKLIKNYKLSVKNCRIYLDAGIKIDSKYLTTYNLKPITLIRGDERINAIKLASIAAKVTRDNYMVGKDQKIPQYQFAIHKGYGTKKHITALKNHGPSPIHRLTFIKKYLKVISV